MRKGLLGFGVIGTICMLFLVVTAVPTVNSSPIMQAINEIEKSEEKFNEQLMEKSFSGLQTTGIIDFLKQLLLLIIQAILNLIDIVRQLIGLVALVEYLIEIILVLVDAVVSLINTILDLFNPNATVI
jgi:hypothetical protein